MSTGSNNVENTVYTWSVAAMDCYPEVNNWQDVVFTVHWRLSATREANGKIYGAGTYGTAPVNTSEIQTFTPYADLTLDQVIGWIYNEINGDQLKINLSNEIDDKINPKVVSLPPPWAITPTTNN